MTQLAWRKSSRSGPNGGDCVEVAKCACQTAIRDSKVPNGPHLTLSPADFAAFLNTVR